MKTQAEKLDTAIALLDKARGAAGTGMFFASWEGYLATVAVFDMFECDGLFDLAKDIRHEIEREIVS